MSTLQRAKQIIRLYRSGEGKPWRKQAYTDGVKDGQQAALDGLSFAGNASHTDDPDYASGYYLGWKRGAFNVRWNRRGKELRS